MASSREAGNHRQNHDAHHNGGAHGVENEDVLGDGLEDGRNEQQGKVAVNHRGDARQNLQNWF